jgi:uncharacterized membrane protein YhaH (DUF805 family)
VNTLRHFADAYRNYADFDGHASRREYWSFTLVVLVAQYIGLNLTVANPTLDMVVLVALVAFSLASIVPALAITSRRLHDTGRTGWHMLVGFVPFVGVFILAYWLLQGAQADLRA